ncbi:MAG: 1-acyl-sn-glycerol-3-phosphate acyltransferase [Myxococcota bacterium]|nr:1-acyl-sn-glycerol-3-phosphate acyltransferase [Myxococcota bacterium]
MRQLFLQISTLSLGVLSFLYLVFILNPIQVLSVLIYPFSPERFRAINRWCARSIWGIWVIMAEFKVKMAINFRGDEIPQRENAILVANHQTMADILLLICFAWRCRRLSDLKFFVKDALKYFPGVGWGMRFLDCVFVKRDWTKDRAQIDALFSKFREKNIPIFLVSFLEGTRFRPKKLAAARRFAESRSLHSPTHTLIPRTKGFVASMRGLSGHVDAVYDLTIAYPERVPSLLDCYRCRVPRIEVYVRRYDARALAELDDEGLSQWAFDRYKEKDLRLQRFQETQRLEGELCLGSISIREWFQAE